MTSHTLITEFFRERPDLLEHVAYLPQEGYDEPLPMLPPEYARAFAEWMYTKGYYGWEKRQKWMRIIDNVQERNR